VIKPPAIARFELLWWGSLLAWIAATGLAWQRTQYVLVSNPATRPAAGFVQPLTIALVVLVTLVPWFFAARRASGAARWAAVGIAVLAVLRVALLLIGSLGVGLPAPVTVGLFVLAAALDVAAVIQLFRPEANAWFDPFEADEETVP
jgi:hypothetical protein